MSDPVLARLAGQCASGAERDGGARIHAVVAGRGVCGAMPGRRSVGWIEVDGAEQPTCPRCIAGLRTANLDALRLRRRDAREVEHRGRTIVHKAAGCWILHAGPGLPKNLRFRTLKAAKRAVDLVARNDAPPAAELLASSSPGQGADTF